jgi:hypothetical protein
MTKEVLKKMYQLLLTEPHAPTLCDQLESIAREALAQPAQEPDHSDELTIAYMSGVYRGKELAAKRQWVGSGDLEDSNAYQTLPAQPVQELEKQLRDALGSLDFYRRRVEVLQQWQSKMRDPERTIVCDILANGHTLEPAGNRYTPPAQPAQEQNFCERCGKRTKDLTTIHTCTPPQENT